MFVCYLPSKRCIVETLSAIPVDFISLSKSYSKHYLLSKVFYKSLKLGCHLKSS